MSAIPLPTTLPHMQLDVLSDTDSSGKSSDEDVESQAESVNASLDSLSLEPAPTPVPPNGPAFERPSTGSLLSPASAHSVRPPSASPSGGRGGAVAGGAGTFKVPYPIDRSWSPSNHLDVFPALNGPQRVGSSSTSTTAAPGRRKVPLEPGHSPLDWARLLTSGRNLRGVPRLDRFTLEDLALHRKRDDVWMAVQGKVYNCTHYVKFHPGGPGQLMRGAGKDATELFMKVHPWVNIDTLLDKCQVGYLVKEK
ncbi:hypothetical protein HKX48_002490 [Thoreauomyces humboldtii]|nr:hypothetical protein HKX48_002490 [Thoreauomyces humboldtii]